MLGESEVIFVEPVLGKSVLVYGVEGSVMSLVMLSTELDCRPLNNWSDVVGWIVSLR